MTCNVSAPLTLNLRQFWRDGEQKRQLPITKETLEKALKLGAEQFRRLQEVIFLYNYIKFAYLNKNFFYYIKESRSITSSIKNSCKTFFESFLLKKF